jgi:hypothetical protein
MYMAFIPNPFNLLLASPMEQTFLYNLMSLFLHMNCHSLSSLNAYIYFDGFHPPIHPIFFMHCKWNFSSNVYLNANISSLGLSFNYQNHTWGLHVLSHEVGGSEEEEEHTGFFWRGVCWVAPLIK